MSTKPGFQRTGNDKRKPTGAIPDFDYIATDEELISYCARMAPEGPVALDTEFVGENTYVPVLELVQICDANKRIGLIDAQTVRSFGPLARVIGDPARVKILHSAKQDIHLLHLLLGVAPVPMFDTQVAAAMVGVGAQISYNNLVRMFLGVQLKGAETISDWSKRPLSESQRVYAAQDVEFLHGLHAALSERVSELGREEWLREELDRRGASITDEDPMPDNERYRTVKDWMKLDGIELALLRELAAWRESEARRRNLSRRMVMSDEGLVMLARTAPETRADVGDLRRVPQGQLYRYLDDILAVVRRALAIPKDQWPAKRIPLRPDIPEGLVELFQAIVRTTADQENIAASLLSTRDELTALAIHRHEPDDLDLPVLQGWRRDMIGEKLLNLLDGRMHLHIENRDRVIIDEK